MYREKCYCQMMPGTSMNVEKKKKYSHTNFDKQDNFLLVNSNK